MPLLVEHLPISTLRCHQTIPPSKTALNFELILWWEGSIKKVEWSCCRHYAGVVFAYWFCSQREGKVHTSEYSHKRTYSTKKWSYTQSHFMSRQGLILQPRWCMQRTNEGKTKREKGELRLGAWIININTLIYQYLFFKVKCFVFLICLSFFNVLVFFNQWLKASVRALKCLPRSENQKSLVQK